MAEKEEKPKRSLRFMKRLWPRVRPYRKGMYLAVVLLLISSGIGLAFPLLAGELLDAAFLEGSGDLLNRIALGLLGLFAFQAVINFSQSYLIAGVSERVVADLRKDIFRKLVRQTPGFFATQRVGELTSRIASDAGLIQGVLRFGLPELARQGIFLIGAMVIIAVTNVHLTLVTLTAIPFAILVGWFFGRRVRKITTGIQDTLASSVARAEQVFSQIRTVQSFTREEWEEGRFGADIDGTRDAGLRRAVERAGLTGAVTFVAFGAIVLVLWEGGRLVLSGDLSAGMLFSFIFYAVFIAGGITSVAGFWSNLQEAAGAAQRIFQILDEETDLPETSEPKSLPSAVEASVAFRGVRFSYGEGQPVVLNGIDLELAPGETVALVGSSGAGKTTLASLVPRFFDVSEGSVVVDGIDVRDLSLNTLRGIVGVVPQEPMLFAGTVRENLMYGRDGATEDEMIAAAKSGHAHEFIARFPDGYDQEIGERGITLSGGQRQRMAIARVMLKRPRILILDEASSSLDAESEALVQDALEHLMKGRTTLVIAHRLSTVIGADRIVVLDQGRIEDVGSHSDLLERSPVYSRLYRGQFEAALASVEASGS